MATGGHHNDGKEMRQKIDSASNGNNLGDRPAGLPWPSLPNNLELNTKSKNTKKKRNKEKVEEHVSSAAAKRNIKVPVNHRAQTFQRTTSKSAMEHENNAQAKEECSKYKLVERENAVKERLTHLQDCIAQVNSVLQHLKQSNEPKMMEQSNTMENILEDLIQKQALIEKLASKNEADVSNDEGDESDPESPFISKPSDANPGSIRAVCITEEDEANFQNHLLEKMKTSQEKLTALKQQQTELLTMRRNAEEKLAAFQAELAKKGMEGPSRDWQYPDEASAADNEDHLMTGDASWKSGYSSGPHVSLPPPNTQKVVKNGQKNFLSGPGDSNTQELTTLHANLEHIKRRLEILQEYSDDRNVADPPSPGEVEIDQNLSNRLLAVEWQRKKLKNRLLELQEKKKASDELMKELSLIKEATNAVENLNGGGDSFILPNIQDLPQLSLHDENDGGALEAMQETISQLRGMLSARAHSSQENQETESAATAFPVLNTQETLVKQNSYRVSPGKRDNLKKGQSDQFPARRHYEAEGRANEDPDVPAAAAAAPAVSPAPDPDVWDKDQRKGKKRKGSQEKQQLIQAMFDSIKGRVGRLPNSVLQAISLLDNEEASSDNDAETATDNEDSPENDDSSSIVEGKVLDVKVKEEPRDPVPESLRRPDEDERAEASAHIDELHNLEQLKDDRDQLMKLHEKFTRLRPKFSSPKQNNEEHRSRAEGGNLQKRKSRIAHSVSLANPLPLQQHRQDNLLTRQNVATVESQSRNNSSNLTRGSNSSLKKDNINDLSAKYNQSTGPSLTRGSSDLLCKYRTEIKGQDLRDSHHHKSHFVDIMKQDRNKLQNYSRNRDLLLHSNSSVNSEPLDGSSSALAPDTTVAATWGGSSTQENFEDENEPFESLEEQEEEEEESNNEDAMVISNSADASMNDNILGDPALTSVPKSYGGSMPYTKYAANSSSKRRDNRLHKYFKSTQLNQWDSRKNFSRPGFQRVHPSDTNREFSVPDDAQVQAEDASQTSAGSLNSTNPMPMPDKFIERLHLQLEKLNALCRPILQEPILPPTMACHPIFPQSSRDGSVLPNPQYPLHNALGRLPQAGPDLMQSYTQQLQLQQQLLLSLSHCYHALYMQQLEIHHLQRCLTQGGESEVPLQQPNPPTQSTEDFTLRPWFLNPWFSSSVPFPPSQVSPMSAPPFMQQSQSAFAFSPNLQVPTTSASTAPRALVTSIQPARAVVHPAAQDSRTSSETLNNQVPPRTRANNFLDNFRSYSRQNLLSSTNVTKGKESTTTGGPQVRQVHPLVPNESNWGHRSRVFIPPHTENVVNTTSTTTTTAPTSDVRSFVRPVTNSDCQGTTIKLKKPNLSRPHVTQVTQSVPDSSSGSVTTFICPEPDMPFRSLPDDGACAEKCGKSKPSGSAVLSPSAQPLPDKIQAEVSRFLAQNSNQEGMLEEFFRELRNIKADSLPRVLGAVKDVTNSERSVFMSPAVRHHESDSHAVQDRPEVVHSTENRLESSSAAATVSSAELTSFKLACENACQRSNQNWPPATIIPLGKHIPKPSTGAVKKRPATRDSAVCNASSILSLFQPMPDSQSSENKTPSRSDSLESTVERVILEVIPFIQCHNMDDCCTSLRANFVAKAIEAVKNNSTLKLSPEFLAQLRQTLMQVANKYSSSKWFECENDLLKTIAGTLFQEMSMYKSMSARLSVEESGDHSAKNSQAAALSSSKPFVEAHKQIIANKDQREISVEVDSGPFPVQEFESNIVDLYVNMPSQENNLPNHCNGNAQHEPVRGAVGGNCSPSLNSWQNHVVSAEEDTCYECDPEAEEEPEVEAGTETDLAEADQSPAPQGAVNGMSMVDGFHVAPPMLSHLSHMISVNSDENVCAEGSASVDNVLNLSLSSQAACNSNPEKEITLDDVPIKLAPMSQEELQRQMAEEQSSNLLLVAHQLDGAEDLSLAGSGDTLKDPPTFI